MEELPYEIVDIIFGYVDFHVLVNSHCVCRYWEEISRKHRKRVVVSILQDRYNQIYAKHPFHEITVLLLTYLYNVKYIQEHKYINYARFAFDMEILITAINKVTILDVYKKYKVPRPTAKITESRL